MSFFTVFIIALGLAMDAFAVSIASGIAIKHLRIRHALLIAIFFGGFQAVMPVIGWLSGIGLRSLISSVDHWVAFGLLTGIGVKMVYEATKIERAAAVEKDPLNIVILCMLAFATSIDALAVGVSFACLNVTILQPALIIGIVTFVTSLSGVYIGDAFGHFFERKIEVFGGIVLMAIGCKILFEHL